MRWPTSSDRDTSVTAPVSRSTWILASVLFLLAAPPARAQEPLTREQIARIVSDPATYDEQTILDLATRSCLSFVPTPAKLAELRRRRPGLSTAFESTLSAACIQNVRLESVEEIAVLLDQRSSEEVEQTLRTLDACPPGGDYAAIRRVALSGAARATVEQLGRLCDVRLDASRWDLSFRAGYTPLSAAAEIRAEDMAFQGGTEIAAALSFAPSRELRFLLELERSGYTFDPPELDFDTGGSFRLLSGGFTVRYLVTCVWRPGCGQHLVTNSDAYVQATVSYNDLNGSVEISDDPVLSGNVDFSFDGPAFGLKVGYIQHLNHWLGVAAEGGYTWIQFQNVEIMSFGSVLEDRLSGTSRRSRLGLSLIAALPF